MPNLPNQTAAVSSTTSLHKGDVPLTPPPYPQEQPPLLYNNHIVKDPNGGDKAAEATKQRSNHAEKVSPKESKSVPPAEESTKTRGQSNQPDKAKQIGPDRPQSNQPRSDQPQPDPVGADQPDGYMPPGYEESGVMPGFVKPQPEELLFEWQAKSRPFKKHNRQFFTSVGIIGLLMALILVFAGQWLPMAVVVAVVFVIYVFNTIPPGEVLQQATTYGIRVEEKLYYWEEMGRFWFTEKYGEALLNIEVARFPNRLTLLLGDLKKEDVEAFLSEILLNQQPPPTTYEKIADWLGRKLPLDLEK